MVICRLLKFYPYVKANLFFFRPKTGIPAATKMMKTMKWIAVKTKTPRNAEAKDMQSTKTPT